MSERKHLTDGPLALTLDSSTTSTKTIVADAAGSVWYTAKENIQLHTPAMDYCEHNSIRWQGANRVVLVQVTNQLSPAQCERVAAIGLAHQRETFAPFDKNGQPFRNRILRLDGRATEQTRRYGNDHIHELSDRPVGMAPGIYKTAWVKEHEPEIFQNTYKVTDVHGYIT